MINTKYIVLIGDNDEIWEKLKKLITRESSKYQIIKTATDNKSVKEALLTVPDLLIIDEDSLEHNDIVTLTEMLRKMNEFAITPIIILSQNGEKEHRLELLKKGIEFYIKKPIDEDYFIYTIKNISRLISSNRCISALTGLPGNVQIENELKRKMASKKTYAVLYVDLDNFKAYNDKYGFMNGDEVIKFTSDLMQDAIQLYGKKGDFLGHVGGDDFVAIIDYDNAQKMGKYITKKFDKEIVKYYNRVSNEDVSNFDSVNKKTSLQKETLVHNTCKTKNISLIK